MFIDVHCHLDLLNNINSVISNARKKRVEKILSAGVSYETNRKILEFSKNFSEVEAVLGIYPIDALKMSEKGLIEEINFIKQHQKEIMGIGEVGMDFKESNEKKDRKGFFLCLFNYPKKSINRLSFIQEWQKRHVLIF